MSGKNLVHLGLFMMHFNKDEETFWTFCVELIAANQSEESWGGHWSWHLQWITDCICKLLQLCCARHLQQRDEKTVGICHQKSRVADKYKSSYQKEILWDICGKRAFDIFQKSITDATNSDNFHAKLLSLLPRREILCPGFYNWFLTHRKKGFLSAIQIARKGCGGFVLPGWHRVTSWHSETHLVLQDGHWYGGSQHAGYNAKKTKMYYLCMVQVDFCFCKITKT